MSQLHVCPHCGAQIVESLTAEGHQAFCSSCGNVLDGSTIAVLRPAGQEVPLSAPNSESDDDVFLLGRRKEDAEMDMTPMVDIVFQLLIFFMVTASFSLQRSLEIPKPEENRPSTNASSGEDMENDPDFVVVRVDQFNTFHVLAPEWEQEEDAPSQNELILKLKKALASGTQGSSPHKMLVKAHGDATIDRVVMALDAGSTVQMQEIKLQTVEEDE